MKVFLISFFAVFAHCSVLFVNGTYLYEHIGALLKDMKAGYEKEVLPVLNHSSLVDVKVFISVYTIKRIDNTKGMFTLQMTGMCKWTDPRMVWKPEIYGNVESVRVPKDNVWKPLLALASSIDYSTLGGFEGKVKYDFTGLATWHADNMVENACTFYMKYWPFDKQVCDFIITVMDYSSTQVQLKSLGINTDFVHMMEWTLEGTTISNGTYGDTRYIVYLHKLNRKSAFYVMTTILPITFIAFLQPFVFLLPSEAGDRVGFSITIVLSLTVYFTIISDQIPRSAEPVALICAYVMLLTLLSIGMTVIVILNLRLRHWPNTKAIGKRFRKLCKSVPESLKSKEAITVLTENMPNEKQVEVKYLPPPDEQTDHQYLKEVESVVKIATDKPSMNESDLSWRDVSNSVDTILFTIAMLVTVVPSTVFLLYLRMASDYSTGSYHEQ